MLNFLGLIIAVLASYSIACGLAYLYLANALKELKKLQADRAKEVFDSTAYKALSLDQRCALNGFVLRELNDAERKGAIFQSVRNGLLIVGGLSPIFAILTTSPNAQKVINAITSISVLLLGVFQVDRFAMEHRRASYLIDRKVMEWLGGSGTTTPTERFEELASEVAQILDTGETSFIGAGNVASASQSASPIASQSVIPIAPPIAQPEVFPSNTEALPPPLPPAKPSLTRIASPVLVPLADDFADLINEWGSMGEVEITQGGTTIVNPEDFAQWQAGALKRSNVGD